ncbi:polysaccharide biosynthesis tyrosine autokinase [Actinoplanes solisilvae]|uniref:polysaccharide biosynthesis tyrosine autokinase n=1 Tax=Actinoplanes solisilvae TaxID=2486853 RepID=UPI000FD749C7|nr:CpsD/CapB family tyrosine-protein kinase [Actinoplanes solisilvae]
MTTHGRPARLLRGWGWWIVLVTVLITAGVYAAYRFVPADYRSTATAIAGPRLRPGIEPVPADAGTEREIARSDTVLRTAATELGIGRDDLVEGLDVEAAGGAAITIAYSGPSAVTAQQRAQAVASEYVRYRNSITSQYGIAATLVSPAGEAVEQRFPLWVPLLSGAAGGLLLGVLSALGLARRRDRLRGRVHFEQQTGVRVLATIPRVPRSRGPGAPLPVLLRSPASADAEAYRFLRARLDQQLRCPATVLVAGGRTGEGRSTTAANLAVALAQSGRRVVLVDTDVRHPALHLMFDLSRDRGLTSVLSGEHTLAETLAAGAIVNLRVLAAGAPRGADLLAGNQLTGLLHELREQCDVVVLDSPPLLGVADAVGLAAHADHVLLVADHSRTTRADAVRAAAELGQVAPDRLAAVLVGVSGRDGGPTPRNRAGESPSLAPRPLPPLPSASLDGPADHAKPTAQPNPAAQPKPAAEPRSAAAEHPQPAPERPQAQSATERPAGQSARPISAKAAIPTPRVYTSAAKAEAEARVQAKAAAEAKDPPGDK